MFLLRSKLRKEWPFNETAIPLSIGASCGGLANVKGLANGSDLNKYSDLDKNIGALTGNTSALPSPLKGLVDRTEDNCSAKKARSMVFFCGRR